MIFLTEFRLKYHNKSRCKFFVQSIDNGYPRLSNEFSQKNQSKFWSKWYKF